MKNLPESEGLTMLLVKYLKEKCDFEAARNLIEETKKTNPSSRSYLASMKLEYQTGNLARAFTDSSNAITAFPHDEKVFILSAKIALKYK